ncbi:MAG: BtrH N-terminal domain-containing protein [Anaerolineales bacterium]
MSLRPVEGFVSLETHHCVTGSMRHIYEAHGHPIREEMLLGLGAGVGFVYWHMKGTTPFLGGRANVGRPGEEGMEKTAGKRTGVKIEFHETGSASKAERALLEMLQANKPVMLQVDMGFLPYLELPEEYHFGAHMIVAAGYDPESERVLIADRDSELHPITMEDLALARGSKFKPFPPKHRWYTFNFAGVRKPYPEEVRAAIMEVATGMLEPPITNLGVKGIRKAARRCLKWPESMAGEQLRNAYFNVFIFIDAEGGTGGGLFRYMYGRFLKQAAAIMGQEGLAVVGSSMQAIGDLWQEVAELFKQAYDVSQPTELLIEATGKMTLIADQEQQAWEQLREIVRA